MIVQEEKDEKSKAGNEQSLFVLHGSDACALVMAVIPAEKTNAANVNERIQECQNAVVQVMVCVKIHTATGQI